MKASQDIPSPPPAADGRPARILPKAENPPGEEGAGAEKHVCGQILKASALMGGSSLINMMIGIVRTKAMAVLLGPAGFGLMGVYTAITDLANSFASMGVNGSGVRQIAEAAASGDMEKVARTATVLRRMTILLGLIGAGVLFLSASEFSRLTFASEEHADAIAVLSLAVFFSCLSSGQGALIQGMRHISDLAKMGILGTILGTVISIPMVYFFGERGLVPSFIALAAALALMSWWYGRKIRIPETNLSISQVGHEAAALLKLGFAFLASALMMTGAAYAVRLILTREVGMQAAGLYQSAWTLGGLYVGFILQSMGTDFYPRLTGVAQDNAACNQMVNQQGQISLLLAGPGVLATLAFAPLVINLFYSQQFQEAVGILRWLCLGMALRIVIWPMGFIILAKGAQALFFWTELAWTTTYLALAWVCIRAFGPLGAGVAFFGSYVAHGVLIYLIVRNLSGYRWLPANWHTCLGFLSAIAAVFLGCRLLHPQLGMAFGALVVAASSLYSLRSLVNLTSIDRIPGSLLKLLGWLRLTPRPSADGYSPVSVGRFKR